MVAGETVLELQQSCCEEMEAFCTRSAEQHTWGPSALGAGPVFEAAAAGVALLFRAGIC